MKTTKEEMYGKLRGTLEATRGKEHAACYRQAQIILLADDEVLAAFITHLAADEYLVGIDCTHAPDGIKEHVDVVFRFSCPRDTICLIPPAFRVRWDYLRNEKVFLEDPYLGPSTTVMMPCTGVAAFAPCAVTRAPIEVIPRNLRIEDGKICADITVKWDLGGGFNGEKDLGKQCIDIGATCYEIFNTGAAGFSVKVELCYEFGDGVHKMCLVLKWKVPFEREKTEKQCFPVAA
jgi:hypothetical protein